MSKNFAEMLSELLKTVEKTAQNYTDKKIRELQDGLVSKRSQNIDTAVLGISAILGTLDIPVICRAVSCLVAVLFVLGHSVCPRIYQQIKLYLQNRKQKLVLRDFKALPKEEQERIKQEISEILRPKGSTK